MFLHPSLKLAVVQFTKSKSVCSLTLGLEFRFTENTVVKAGVTDILYTNCVLSVIAAWAFHLAATYVFNPAVENIFLREKRALMVNQQAALKRR